MIAKKQQQTQTKKQPSTREIKTNKIYNVTSQLNYTWSKLLVNSNGNYINGTNFKSSQRKLNKRSPADNKPNFKNRLIQVNNRKGNERKKAVAHIQNAFCIQKPETRLIWHVFLVRRHNDINQIYWIQSNMFIQRRFTGTNDGSWSGNFQQHFTFILGMLGILIEIWLNFDWIFRRNLYSEMTNITTRIIGKCHWYLSAVFQDRAQHWCVLCLMLIQTFGELCTLS